MGAALYPTTALWRSSLSHPTNDREPTTNQIPSISSEKKFMLPDLKNILTDAQIETLITTLCKHDFASEQEIDDFIAWAEETAVRAACLDLTLQNKLDVLWREGEPTFRTIEETFHVEPGLYRHYKGAVYQVFGVIKHSESLEELVLYGDESPKWVRPVADFLKPMEVNGKTVLRFEKACQNS